MSFWDYSKYAAEHSNPVGAPSTKPASPPAKLLPLCSKCFTIIGQGKTHICQKSTKRENLSNLVRNVSSKSKAKVASNTLKSIAAEQGVSTRGGVLKLQTGSKALPVQIGTPKLKPKEAKFSHENLKRLQAATNMSDSSLM